MRWSALGLGVIYGVYHQMSISARDRLHAQHAEYSQKQNLISQAKAEFQRSSAPASETNSMRLSL
jgi:F-type H+-transporting ATP synthase subunit e